MSLLLLIGMLLQQAPSNESVVPLPAVKSSSPVEAVDLPNPTPRKVSGEVSATDTQIETSSFAAEPTWVAMSAGFEVPLVAPQVIAPQAANPSTLVNIRSSANWHTSSAALKLLHVPYGQWVEIEGVWFHHRPTNPMETILVEYQPSGAMGRTPLPTVVVRIGRDPSDIRVGKNTHSKQVTLLPHHSVELDYMREFGDGRPEAPPEKRFEAGRSSSRIGPAGLLEGATNQPCNRGTTHQDNSIGLKFESAPSSTYNFEVNLVDSKVSSISPPATAWLMLVADKKTLGMLTRECHLSATEVTLTISGDIVKKSKHCFINVRLGLELKRSTHLNAAADIWLSNDSLSNLIHDHLELQEFLHDAASIDGEMKVKLHLIDPKIEFNNGLFPDDIEYPIGKILELQLKISKPE